MGYILEALGNYTLMLLMFIALEVSIYVYYKKKNVTISKGFIIGWQLLACLITAILTITGTAGIDDIFKYGYKVMSLSEINLIPFNDGLEGLYGLVMNVIMFIPFGIALPLLWKKDTSFKQTAYSGFAFSLIIEASQLLNHRATDINDLIMNTLGAMIGFGIYYLLFKKITIFQVDNISSSKVVRNSSVINTILILVVYFFVGSPLISFVRGYMY